MNEKTCQNLILNFKESGWEYDDNNKTCIYREDYDLVMKLQNNRKREDDDQLNGHQWDDLFIKYPGSDLIDVVFLYNSVTVDEMTFLNLGNVIIPLPVAANMIDHFFQNEFDIARLLSDNKNKFDDMMKEVKKIKKEH